MFQKKAIPIVITLLRWLFTYKTIFNYKELIKLVKETVLSFGNNSFTNNKGY